MRTLYHLWLSPGSRKIRLVLHEKRIDFTLKVEETWKRNREFLALNPTGEVPVLTEADGGVIAGAGVIAEYLDEIVPAPPLIGRSPRERAEVRRLVHWFDVKFAAEVSEILIGEKIMKRFLGRGEPDVGAIRAAHANIRYHMDYITYLADRRKWLGGSHLSLADISAAAHLSVLDYLGDVPWDKFATVKDWYARIKSRPSFRPLLADRIPGLAPPAHYANLDF